MKLECVFLSIMGFYLGISLMEGGYEDKMYRYEMVEVYFINLVSVSSVLRCCHSLMNVS